MSGYVIEMSAYAWMEAHLVEKGVGAWEGNGATGYHCVFEAIDFFLQDPGGWCLGRGREWWL